MIMKKTMMMAAILGVTALTAASFTGCSSAPRTISATNPAKQAMPSVSVETAVAVKPTVVATEATTEAATEAAINNTTIAVISTEPVTEAPTSPAKAETAPATTAPAAAKETTTETTESRDADFTWITSGVYKVTTEGSELGTYYVFSDKQNGRVDTVSGIGIGFTYEQNRNGMVFHMGCNDDTTVMNINDALNGTITGTMYGRTYTFTLVNGADPATFDAATYENANAAAQTCNDGQNPVMNFIGTYSNGRAMMHVSERGKDQAVVTISWSSSAFETTNWNMSGTVTQVGDTLVMNYQDCYCETFLCSEDGTASLSVIDYTNGTGCITFSGYQAVWEDYEQGVADGQIFTYVRN